MSLTLPCCTRWRIHWQLDIIIIVFTYLCIQQQKHTAKERKMENQWKVHLHNFIAVCCIHGSLSKYLCFSFHATSNLILHFLILFHPFGEWRAQNIFWHKLPTFMCMLWNLRFWAKNNPEKRRDISDRGENSKNDNKFCESFVHFLTRDSARESL